MEEYHVGQELNVGSRAEAYELSRKLDDLGLHCWWGRNKLGGFRVIIDAYHPPVTRDEDGYFVEDDALDDRILYEMDRASEEAIDHFFMTNQERGDSENCLQIVRGKWKGTFWGDDKLYITPELLLYTNLEQAIRVVIPDFDVYGLDYTLSRDQWAIIKSIDKGRYLKEAVDELAAWVDETADPVLTILCI